MSVGWVRFWVLVDFYWGFFLMSRFRLVFVALVAAFALLLQGVVPASAGETGVRFSGEAADFLSARVQAEASNHGKR